MMHPLAQRDEGSIGLQMSAIAVTANRAALPIVSAIIAAAFALRFSVFSVREVGLDGGLAVGLASIAIPDMLAFNLRDVHPPLFYLALSAWLAIGGTTFVAAKWLTIACGVLAIPVLYQIVKRTIGSTPALFAALLLTAAPAHIFLSPTVRDFSAGLLLSLLTILLLLRLVDESGRSTRRTLLLWAALAALTGAALLTWYFHVLYLSLEAFLLAILRPRQTRLAALALGTGALIAVPWLSVAATPLLGKALGATGGSPEIPPLDPASFAREMAIAFVGNGPWATLLGLWVLLVVFGLAYGLARKELRTWSALSLAGIVAGLAVVYLIADRWVHGVFYIRYMLVPLPFAIMTQVTPLAMRPIVGRRMAGLAIVVLLVPSALWFVDMVRSEPIPYGRDAISLQVEPRIAKDDAVIFTDIARLGSYLLSHPEPAASYSVHFAGAPYLEDDVSGRGAELLRPLLARHRRIWLVNTATYKDKPGSLLKKTLARSLVETPVLREGDFEVTAYDSLVADNGMIVFGDTLKLLGYRVRNERTDLAPGENLTLDLVWTALGAVEKDYSVSLQVLDGAGQLAAQGDGPPAKGDAPTTTWRAAEQIVDTRSIKLPDKPGDYSLGIALYDLSTMQRLAVAGSATDLADLQRLRVR